MPDILSNLNMQGSRIRNLQAPQSNDEPVRKQDISGDRIYKLNSASGIINIDWSIYDEVRLTLAGNVTLSFTNATDGQKCVLKIKQGGSGGYSLTLPSSVRYSMDMRSFSPSAQVGGVDRIGFMYDADDSAYDFVAAVRNLAFS